MRSDLKTAVNLVRPLKLSALSIYSRLAPILQDHRIGWVVLLLVSLVPLIAFGHGHDFFMHYRRRTLSGEYGLTTWLPYYGYWFIMPFALLPPSIALAVWNLANACGLGLLCKRWGVNPLLLALLFPTLYMFGNGQIEGLIAFGVTLSFAASPLIAGFGLTILSIKPQLTFFIGLYVLLRRFHWQLLVAPGLIFIASLLQWGIWMPEWFASLRASGGGLSETAWNASFYPWGLAILPGLWFFRKKPRVWLVIPPLVMPYYAIYSLALPLTVGVSAWLWILTWVVSLIYVTGGYTPLWALVTLGLVWQAYKYTQD